ncbi:hypothetical protein BD324DRAFT_642750 [Kockovaella imperatae]|uniref:DUF221-domain-containing protein n=1 Tax=Kockovaella imperatae TaxID=4999 RepID=A0A1Y1UEY5_9TREE|nr:hypothetical protein BD324DRAFT_642750 [Kockovaella imperatae]ORX36074.1 hypothetical protein BD324DRAFT_642750 [Kockovaella imperatae]
MADLSQHTNYTGAYSGLLDNLWVTLAIAGICLVGHEIEVHIPRRHGKQGTFRRIPVRVVHAAGGAWRNWRSKRRKDRDQVEQGTVVEEKEQKKTPREKLGSRESWEFGYIFQPKAWRLNPAPPAPRWPLAWIVSSLRIKERDMPETCGIDVTLHMRFIRGSFFYVLLQACTVLPILLPVHVHYAPSDLKKSSMLRAGISSLVKDSGTRWLWIHAFLIWWVTITWTLTLLWITWGGLAYRRRENRRLERSLKHSREALSAPVMVTAPTKEGNETARPAVPRGADEPEGAKRFRTLIVENIPPDMRNEDVLRDYFDHYLERHRLRSGEITHTATWVKKQVEEKQGQIMRHVHFRPSEMFKAKPSPVPPIAIAIGDSQPMTRGDTEQTFDVVDHDSADGMMESEVDEIILVRKLGAVQSLRARRNAVLRQLEVAHVKLAKRVLKAVAAHQKKHSRPENMYTQLRPVHDMDAGLDALNGPRDEHLPTGLSREERLDRLTAALGGFVADSPEQLGESSETVWDILHALPRALLDPYQALTHLKVTSFFRDQNAPLIDYLTTKLNYLSHRLDAARDKPLSSYNPSSTAFVTFRDARTARLAHKLLESHPTRTLACRTSPAPDWTNLLWPRLSMSIYRSEFVRKWVVQVGVWVFTLLWIFPVSLLCALSSFNNIAGFFKPLRAFLSAHPKAAGAISSLAPVILVAGLTLAICPILLVIANKAETINTRLAIHNSVMERFWKFLMVNGVVFFAIGQSAIEAYLTAFQNRDFDPLPVVASAFPTAAPYFASYILLQVAIQPGFEIFRFGLPTIVYVFGTRVSIIPRQRNGRTEYPTFSHFSQVPLQLLQGAIMHLFMLLNPLVIPFALVYYGMVYVVWKRQFTYVYGRLYENNGRRTSIRVLRYGLDALAYKAKGNAIATGVLFFLTLGEKLM